MIRVQQKDLYKALRALKPYAKGFRTFPITQYVEIIVNTGSGFEIHATNLEVYGKVKVPSHNAGNCTWFLFPFEKLLGLTLESSGEIEIDCQDNKWFFDSGSGAFYGDLIGVDVSDFPAEPPATQDQSGADVPIDTLLEDLQKLAHMRNDRFPLRIDGKYSRLYLTDGHRLNSVSARYLPQGQANIPSESLPGLISSLKLFSGSLSLGLSEKYAQISNDEFTFYVHTTEDTIPDPGFIGDPQQLPAAWIEKKDLLKALKLTKIFCSKPHADLNIRFRPYCLTFRSEIQDCGFASHDVDCYVPADLAGKEIRVSHKYFWEAIRAIPDDNIPIRTSGYMTIIGNEILAQKGE